MTLVPLALGLRELGLLRAPIPMAAICCDCHFPLEISINKSFQARLFHKTRSWFIGFVIFGDFCFPITSHQFPRNHLLSYGRFNRLKNWPFPSPHEIPCYKHSNSARHEAIVSLPVDENPGQDSHHPGFGSGTCWCWWNLNNFGKKYDKIWLNDSFERLPEGSRIFLSGLEIL